MGFEPNTFGGIFGRRGQAYFSSLHCQFTGKCVKAEIVVLGDSTVKYIESRKLRSKKVHKFTYPGKTAGDIEKELNYINIQSTPSHIIVHAGIKKHSNGFYRRMRKETGKSCYQNKS